MVLFLTIVSAILIVVGVHFILSLISRDYYDVWQLLKSHSSGMSYKEVIRIFLKKCDHKHLIFNSMEDFVTKKKTELARSYWKRGLAHQMQDLPDFDVAMKKLRGLLEELF